MGLQINIYKRVTEGEKNGEIFKMLNIKVFSFGGFFYKTKEGPLKEIRGGSLQSMRKKKEKKI